MRKVALFSIPLIMIGLLCVSSAFFPGLMSADSIAQLDQARTGNYGDWHPPVMSLLWALLDQVYAGPFLLIVFHNLLFWTGMAWIYSTFFGPRLASFITALAIGLSPPLFALLGTAWKDVGFACSLVFVVGCLVKAASDDSKLTRYLTLGLSVLPALYALAVRHNSFPALFPLIFWGGVIGFSRCSYSAIRRHQWGLSLFVSIAFLTMSVLVTHTLTKYITRNQSTYPVQQILLHDLAAISLDQNRLIFPTIYLKGQTLETIRHNYTPSSVVSLFCCNQASIYLPLISNGGHIEELKKLWIKTVRLHWRPYLRHRLNAFRAQFAIGISTVCNPFHLGIDQNKFGIEFKPPGYPGLLFWKVMKRTQNTFLFRGWFWLLLSAGIVAGSLFWVGKDWKKCRTQMHFTLFTLSSGILYALPYFFISTTCDFRMHWWTVVSTLIVLPVFAQLISQLFTKKNC